MSLLRDLISSVQGDAPVRSILVGVHWAVVCSRSCGMAAAIRADHPHGAPDVRDAGRLLSRSARELAELAFSASPLEASIGVAALNSLLEVDESQAVEVNAAEVLAERGKDRNVALIGSFPFIPQLRQSAGQLWVIEQRPSEGEYPAEAAPDLLPRADLVAITSSALVNGTLDGLLALCPPQSTVMLLGPSTPLSPVLFDYGVDILSGARVVDEAAVLRTVGQGASFRQVEGVRLLTFVRQKE
ncbi:MAG: Rossmann-like domain-containing protein [Chloroflexota bacterium]